MYVYVNINNAELLKLIYPLKLAEKIYINPCNGVIKSLEGFENSQEKSLMLYKSDICIHAQHLKAMATYNHKDCIINRLKS